MAVQPQTGEIRASSRRALVLEDDAVIALDVQDMLASLGYDPVDVAHSADAAIARISTSYAVAIVDVKLEHGDSSAVALALRKAGTPFVITTGYSDSGELAAAFKGAPCLVKPFDEAGLKGALAKALGNSVAP